MNLRPMRTRVSFAVDFMTDEGRTQIYVEADSAAGAILDVIERYKDVSESDSLTFNVHLVGATR